MADSETAISTNPNDITETITIPEHGGPGDIDRALKQINRVATALAGRLLIGGAFGATGAGHPVMQNIVQCASAAATALAIVEQQRAQLFSPQYQVPRGRA